MAGGVGTGLFIRAQCVGCNFDQIEEVDFSCAPTEGDIREAKDFLEEVHHKTGCNLITVFSISQGASCRKDLPLVYNLPELALVLLIR